MATNSIVRQCSDQLVSYLQSIASLNAVLSVYNVKDLVDGLTGVKYPVAGVVYDGLRSVPEPGAGPTDRKGLSAEVIFSVMLLLRTEAYGPTNQKDIAIDLLDSIRDRIKGTSGPSGHRWRFVVEAPASEQKGSIIWAQRWALPVMLS